jgi:hypothetical protein
MTFPCAFGKHFYTFKTLQDVFVVLVELLMTVEKSDASHLICLQLVIYSHRCSNMDFK